MTPDYTSIVNHDQYVLIGQAFWALVALLIVLITMRRLADDIRPIITNIVAGVAQNAAKNAVGYAFAIGFGLSASLLILSDEATKLGWVYVAVAAKVAQPFIAGCVAYATKGGIKTNGAGTTTPPFQPPPA